MTIDVFSLGDRLVKIVLTGRLDTAAAGRLETRFIASLVPGGNNGVVDLSRVEFVASIGIRMFVTAARSLRQKQAKLAVYGATPQVQQVFEAVALGQIVSICATETDALAAVGAPPS